MDLRITGGAPLVGDVRLPADKSILHRALILAAMADGESRIEAHGPGRDNQSTVTALRALGVRIDHGAEGAVVEGRGVAGLRPPNGPLDCGNSGTTMRLLAGVLTGAGIEAVLIGDRSLSRRPMARICSPLRDLGGKIAGERTGDEERSPLRTGRGRFLGGEHHSSIPSAQVKSALLLAGVASGTAVAVTEPFRSRDHTERLLAETGNRIVGEAVPAGYRATLASSGAPRPMCIRVPGDVSAAAYLIAAGTLITGSRLRLVDVGLNPTRTGALDILEELGGGPRVASWAEQDGEPRGTLEVTARDLRSSPHGGAATVIDAEIVPRLIDEIPLLAAVAVHARGAVQIRDASELRVKESNRIAETVRVLAAFGAEVEPQSDGLLIHGPQTLRAADIEVGGDHRIALTAAVLALAAPGETVLRGFEIAAVSYPGFVNTLEALGARLRV